MTLHSPSPQTTTYPAAPWSLLGRALVSTHAVDIAAMREFLPATLEILPIFPGKTLGGIYLSSYETGSALLYNELIVFCGLVKCGDRLGSWITHIYVDNPQSVAGGREIWGLPKQLASFRWTAGASPQVAVEQDDQLLCRFKYQWQLPGVPVPSLPTPGTFSLPHNHMAWFPVQGSAKVHLLMGTEIDVPATSPFASLGLHHPMLAFNLDELSLLIDQPRDMS